MAQFKAVPHDGKAVSEYTNQNLALLEVATELRRLANRQPVVPKQVERPDTKAETLPQEARYRIRKDFDQVDERDFVERSYNEIYRFFEASVRELEALPDIEARLSPLDSGSFSCTLINRGFGRGFETIHVRRGGSWGAIEYLFGEENSRTASNGGFAVEADDYQLHLRSTGFRISGGRMPMDRETVSASEAAQLMWDELLSKVGIDYA
ncbi:hypothetical protein H9L13_00025 [Sphingomonas lutea]|uniref:Uncharacterized protein n=1 Tax=Sphingomonas lutea TaxID=1045317 RepID=A0A7G9SHT0_9SPHN|nr:hypothetical protein [Sphingomonas lutea]QNN67405.1 hypothetical protein H9L13_00025 [Sphingomonas lutea]